MYPPARRQDLTDALESDSEDLRRYFDRQTGLVVIVGRSTVEALESEDEAELDALPEWQREEIELARVILADEGKDERFIAPPAKFEFHEYRHMERFIGTIGDADIANQLWQSIKGKGAFRYFKDTLHRLGLEKSWYAYRDQAMKDFVLAWADGHGITVIDQPPRPPGG